MNKEMKEKIKNIFLEEDIPTTINHKKEVRDFAGLGLVLSILPASGMLADIKPVATAICITFMSIELYNLAKENKKLSLVKENHITKSRTR